MNAGLMLFCLYVCLFVCLCAYFITHLDEKHEGERRKSGEVCDSQHLRFWRSYHSCRFFEAEGK